MRDPARQLARIAARIFVVGLGCGCQTAPPPSQVTAPATQSAATGSPVPDKASTPQGIPTTHNSDADAEAENLLHVMEKLSSERGIHFVTYDASHHPIAIALPGVAATDSNLRVLARFPTLRSISLLCVWRAVPAESFVPLSKLPMLQTFEIHSAYPALSTELAAVLRTIRTLEELQVMYAPIDRRALRMLSTLPRLHTLKIEWNSTFNDADAAVLADFGTVEKLDLSGTGITDTSLPFIEAMPNLKWLSLNFTQVTDDGLNAIRMKHRIKVVQRYRSDVPTTAHY